MPGRTASRDDVLRFRVRRHQLDRPFGTASGPADVELLDYGVQDTGPDGAAWALAARGAPAAGPDDLVRAWTLRGAPHVYRRPALDEVAIATAPLSEADAAKRVFDASKPLKAAGIPVLEALGVVAGHMRAIVTRPTVKGDLSGRLTEVLDEPYLRHCRPCDATHPYEMTFRLAALQAGLELEPGTSPPVLRPVPGMSPPMYGSPAGATAEPFDVIRNHLRFYGPARVGDVTAFVDAPVREVRAHWPEDALEVEVTGAPPGKPSDPRYILAGDVDELVGGEGARLGAAVRLLGSHDPYLQVRDRELLVGDAARRKDLWRTLGRPGAVLVGGEVAATWRPRTAGGRLTVRVEPWRTLGEDEWARVGEEAERLATHRGVALAGVAEA